MIVTRSLGSSCCAACTRGRRLGDVVTPTGDGGYQQRQTPSVGPSSGTGALIGVGIFGGAALIAIIGIKALGI